MADFDIVVDTREMADSIDSVSRHVSGVTTAVVAMESAVVSAQNEASRKICANVDNGFYMLLRSQLSQKIAAVSSELISKEQLLEAFKKEVERIMLIMTNDYERIKLRYTRHFNSLDNALSTRIHELDKYAYEIARTKNMSDFKNNNEIMKTLVYNDETLMLNVREVNAVVKNKSVRAMDVMTNDVIENVSYNKKVAHILKEQKLDCETQSYVPVIVVETDSMFTNGASVNDIYAPQDRRTNTTVVLNQVQSDTKNFTWRPVAENSYNSIKNEFIKKCSAEQVDERIAKEMLRLFEDSKWNEATTEVK